jgi:prevent-host-death family protein
MEVAVSEFKAKCIQLLKNASQSDQELVVTLRGKPMARVMGIGKPAPRRLGGQSDAFAGDVPDEVLIHSDLGDDWNP